MVQKYGGSSVADVAGLRRVARRIADTKNAGHQVVVIVSAMGDTTDDLLELSQKLSPQPVARELDMLLSSGERMSAALLAMAVNAEGASARSFTGSQAGVITTAAHGDARIVDITPVRVREAVDAGDIAIIAGFQGVSQDTKDVTTLGRGASDTTAVAVAAALNAEACEIYTDVDGVFTADPRIVPAARRVELITTEEMLEMAACGAKVLHLRCVEYARRFGVKIHVRSSFSLRPGTWVVQERPASALPASGVVDPTEPTSGVAVEEPIISGVAHDRSQAKITVVGVPDQPGRAAAIFTAVAGADVNIDMIVQNVSTAADATDVTFTLPKDDGERALQALKEHQSQIGFAEVRYDDQIGKVSLIGAGMRSHPGVSATFFAALAQAHVNIEMISTSEIRISVITREDAVEDAVRVVHTAFGLDADQVEAVVYGGTGR